MLDVMIMQHSDNKKGLRDVCRILYNDFGKKEIGYKEEDILRICGEVAGTDLSGFFKNYVYGTRDFLEPLQTCFDYLGIHLERKASAHVSESVYGFKTVDFGNYRKVSLIAPGSPAWNAGLSAGDEVLAVNGYSLKNDFHEWMTYFKSEQMVLTVSSGSVLKKMFLTTDMKKSLWFEQLKLSITDTNSGCFDEWLSLNK
jgi:predicted metalloprotease with PDZ domain